MRCKSDLLPSKSYCICEIGWPLCYVKESLEVTDGLRPIPQWVENLEEKNEQVD